MSQVIMPNQGPKQDALGALTQGMQIAGAAYGIAANKQKLDNPSTPGQDQTVNTNGSGSNMGPPSTTGQYNSSGNGFGFSPSNYNASAYPGFQTDAMMRRLNSSQPQY